MGAQAEFENRTMDRLSCGASWPRMPVTTCAGGAGKVMSAGAAGTDCGAMPAPP